MKKLGIALSVAAVTLFCGGLLAFGQLPQGSLTTGNQYQVEWNGSHTAVWTPTGGGHSHFAGIYGGTVNGMSTGLICDDFAGEIYPGETWTAVATQASALSTNLGNTLFGSTIGITGYAEVATLVNMMFNGTTTYGSISNITQAELTSALWDITTPGGIAGLDSTAQNLVADLGSAYKGNVMGATNYLASLTNLWVLTPTSWPANYPQPQEVWVQVAEGGAAWMYLLMALAACVGFIRFGRREQTASL